MARAIMFGVLFLGSVCAAFSVTTGSKAAIAIQDAKINGSNANSTANPTSVSTLAGEPLVNLLLNKRIGNLSESIHNQTDMSASESRSRYRVSHVSPEYRHHHHHHHHRHSSPSSGKYVESKPRGYQDVSDAPEEPGPVRKEDPDYGQHYDSDGHKYDFGYDVKDKEGALTFRKETGDAKSLKGSYGIRDVDGRLRIVRYVADDKGFRAKVETNEPGTGSEDAANVYFNGYDAEKIPSHDVVHKDRGQHSFKHGHYNAHVPLDSGLQEGGVAVDDSVHEESGKYQYQYDQIPMEINPTQERRVTLSGSSLDSNVMDGGEASHDHYYKEHPHSYSPRYRYSQPPPPPPPPHHHSHRYPNGPIYAEYHPKRRIDQHMVRYRKIPDFSYNIPYNTLTGFYRTRYF